MSQQVNSQIIELKLESITDLMFDRYPGDNNTQLPVEKKLYIKDNNVVLPSMNILSLLTAENTRSITKDHYGKKAASVLIDLRSSLTIEEAFLPIIKNGKPLIFNNEFDSERGGKLGIYVDRRVARLAKGVPNPKERPTISTPWEIKFTIELDANDTINTDEFVMLLRKGGRKIGIGTYRGVFGRFNVEVLSVKDTK